MLLLRDLINEKILLEEVGKLYKCADGYGYNPFTKQCYPIVSGFDVANYSSIAPPKPVIKSGPDGKDPNADADQPGYDLSAQGAGEAFIDVVDLFKTPFDSSKYCWDKHPIATIFGVMTGTGATSALLKTALRASVGVLKIAGLGTGPVGGMVAIGGLATLAAAYFAYAVYQDVKAEYDELRSLNPLDLVLGSTEDNLRSIEKGSNVVHKINDIVKTGGNLVKTGEEKIGGPLDVNKSSISCFLFVTTGTFALKKMAATGLRAAGLSQIRTSKIFLQDVSARLSGNIKNVVSRNFRGSHSDAYIFLKSSGLLPANAGSLRASARGADEFFVEVADAAATQVRIPINNFPPDIKKAFTNQFKKLINGNDVILDITKVNDEFSRASRETFNATQKLYEKQAGKIVKDSSLIDDIAKIRKIIARGGSLNPNQLLNNYFKASAEILQDIVSKNVDKLKTLQELSISLKKGAPNLSPKDLKKAHEAIIAGYEYIGNSISPTYVRNFKQYVKLEQELYQQFSMAKKVMEKDAKFTKIYSNNANMNSLKKWFKTPGGQQARTKVEESVEFLKQVSLDLYDVGRATSLSKTLKYFAYTAFLGGAVYFGPKVTKKVRDNISLPIIDKKASEFFKEVVIKNENDYFIKDKLKRKVKVVKLFKDFENYYYTNIEPGEKRTVPAVKQLIEFATATNNMEVEKFFNEQKTVRAGVEELEKDFRSFLAAQLMDEEDEQDTQELEENKGIEIMTTKNLKEAVRQVMSENSGMGYQKYPYNSTIEDEDNEPTEDYIEEWKGLSLSLVRDETRETAIQIAKILVKDLELFEDVLDLAGQNQSIGTEILKKLKEVQSQSKE